MRIAFLSALLLLAGCGRSEVYGGNPSFPVPWVEDDMTGTDRPDGGSSDGGLTPSSPDAGVVPSACEPAPCPVEALATGQQSPLGLAVSSAHVYWVNVEGDIVRRWPKRGGAVENVSVTEDRPFALAVDETHVYWVSQQQTGELARAPVSGGQRERLVALPHNQSARLVLAGTHLYWGDSSVARVARVATSGGTPEPLMNSNSLMSELSADATGVYFTEGSAVARLAQDRTRSELAAMPPNLMGIATAVDADAVYVVARLSDPATSSQRSCEASLVARVPKAGGAWTELARHPDCASDMGVDATHVYWMAFANDSGGATSILRVPKAGGTPELLASGQPHGGRMAVDDTHVYWTEVSAGRVARVRK